MRGDIKIRVVHMQSGVLPEGYQKSHNYIFPKTWGICKLHHRFNRLKNKNSENNENVLTISAKQGLISQYDYYNHSYASEDKSEYWIIHRGDYSYNKSYSTDYPYGAIKRLEIFESGIVSPLYICFESNSKTNSDFYMHYFEAGVFNREIYKIAQEGARNHGLLNVAIDEFFSAYLLDPTAAEQQKIAEILNHCDKVIELKQQYIKEERERKRWLMQNLFDPDKGIRLHGFSGKWSKCLLSKVGKFSKGTGISTDDCRTGQSPCIKYGDIYMSYSEFFITPVSHTEDHIAVLSPKVKKGTLLFTASGEDRLEIGKCVAYLGDDSIAVGGDIVILHTDTEQYDSMFLSYQQNTDALIKQKAALAQGYSIVHLYGDHIRKLVISVPPTKAEQCAISNLIAASDFKIELLEQELAQWQKKKRALMQLLLTGLVRVIA